LFIFIYGSLISLTFYI